MATITQAGKRNEVITWTTSLLTTQFDLTTFVVTDYDFLTVWWQLQSTTTITDLTVLLNNLAQDGVTVNSSGMVSIRNQVPVSDGVNVNAVYQFDVRGMDKVIAAARNNNAGTKALLATAYLAQRS